MISKHVLRWKFEYPDELGLAKHLAVQGAAKFLCEHSDEFGGEVLNNSTQLAISAIKVHDVFLNHDKDSGDELSVVEIVTSVKTALQVNQKT